MKTQNDETILIDPEKRFHRDYVDYERAARLMGLAALGQSTVFRGNIHDPNLTVGQLANAFMVQLFDASQLAPGDMKDKVLAYQEEVMEFAMHYIREAMRLENTRIGLALEAAGHSAAAALVRSTQI